MKKLILVAITALALSACAAFQGTPQTPAQSQASLAAAQYQSCVLYRAAQPKIAQEVTTLPIKSATTLLEASDQAANLCKTVFINNAQAAASLTQALTTITALTAINLSQ